MELELELEIEIEPVPESEPALATHLPLTNLFSMKASNTHQDGFIRHNGASDFADYYDDKVESEK